MRQSSPAIFVVRRILALTPFHSPYSGTKRAHPQPMHTPCATKLPWPTLKHNPLALVIRRYAWATGQSFEPRLCSIRYRIRRQRRVNLGLKRLSQVDGAPQTTELQQDSRAQVAGGSWLHQAAAAGKPIFEQLLSPPAFARCEEPTRKVVARCSSVPFEGVFLDGS
jgi:hypothetical protein